MSHDHDAEPVAVAVPDDAPSSLPVALEKALNEYRTRRVRATVLLDSLVTFRRELDTGAVLRLTVRTSLDRQLPFPLTNTSYPLTPGKGDTPCLPGWEDVASQMQPVVRGMLLEWVDGAIKVQQEELVAAASAFELRVHDIMMIHTST